MAHHMTPGVKVFARIIEFAPLNNPANFSEMTAIMQVYAHDGVTQLGFSGGFHGDGDGGDFGVTIDFSAPPHEINDVIADSVVAWIEGQRPWTVDKRDIVICNGGFSKGF